MIVLRLFRRIQMDLTPLYIACALIGAVFFYGFITIEHPPIKALLQLMLGGVVGVVLYVSTIPL